MKHAAVEMRNITKIFNGKAANDHVNFTLRRGTIHGLLGENGAGKTTLMNILYGLYKPEAGEILLNGNPVDIQSPEKAISLGIGMVHQHFMLANPLTVTENIMAGKFRKRQIMLHKDEFVKDITRLAERYKMKIDPHSCIWQNSVGEQQRIEILSALYQDVDILILDEPTAVLTPSEVEELFHTLRMLVDDGKSIVMITHKLEEILSVADEVTVLRTGKNVACCSIDDSVCREDLSSMMIGYEIELDIDRHRKCCGDVMLSLDSVHAQSDKGLDALHDISFDIHEGEILGVAGVDGNGQKELCEVLTGLRPLSSGKLTIDGVDFSEKKAKDFIHSDVSYVPEDRKEMGLALGWSISRNLIIKEYTKPSYASKGMIRFKHMREHAKAMIERYDIRANSENDLVKDLSGGNQQKVILARELHGSPKVLIANQPTRGVDIKATMNIRREILASRNNGAAVLLVSADLEEIMQLSDRIAVMYEGRIMDILPGNASLAEVGPLMLGNKRGGSDETPIIE